MTSSHVVHDVRNCRRCFSHGGVFPRMGAAAEWVAGKANKVINSISL